MPCYVSHHLSPHLQMSNDPVAAKSSWLSTYMSNHPDTLTAYVTHFTKNKNVASATMDSINSKVRILSTIVEISHHSTNIWQVMTLTYSVKGSSDKKQAVIPFDPPLLGYEEVKPRLLEMKVNAEVALGMESHGSLDFMCIY